MLKAAKTIHGLHVGDHHHQRVDDKNGDWILDCPPCEKMLAESHDPLWGRATDPAPQTVDEIRAQEAREKAANLDILKGLAAMPQMAETLQALAASVKQDKPAGPHRASGSGARRTR